MLGALGGNEAADSFWGLGFLPPSIPEGGAGGGGGGAGGSASSRRRRTPRTSFAASDEEGSLGSTSAARLHACPSAPF